MIEIEIPGGVAEFPDGTPPDVIRTALQRRFANEGVVTDEPGGGWNQDAATTQHLAEIDPMGGGIASPEGQAVGASTVLPATIGLATAGAGSLPGAAGVAGQMAIRGYGGYEGYKMGKKATGSTAGGALAAIIGALAPDLAAKGLGRYLRTALAEARVGAPAVEGAVAAGEGATAAAEKPLSQVARKALERAAAKQAAEEAAPKTLEGILKFKPRNEMAEGMLRARDKVAGGADTFMQELGLSGAIAEPAVATAGKAAGNSLLEAAKASGSPMKVGQKVWMLLKDGKFVKTLTPDQARAAEAAGETVTWVKNLGG